MYRQDQLSLCRFPWRALLTFTILHFAVQVACERCFDEIENGSCHPSDTIATHVSMQQCCDFNKGVGYSQKPFPKTDGEFECIKCQQPVDGSWGEWSTYSPCSATCDEGTQVRSRSCNNPSPSIDGKPCYMQAIAYKEIISCKIQDCLTTQTTTTTTTTTTTETTRRTQTKQAIQSTTATPSPFWGDWKIEEPCNATCGNGTLKRKRSCYVLNKEVNSNRCQGKSIDFQTCQLTSCGKKNNVGFNADAQSAVAGEPSMESSFIVYIVIAIIAAVVLALAAGIGFCYYKKGSFGYHAKNTLYNFDKDTTVLTYRKVPLRKEVKNSCCAENFAEKATSSSDDGYEIPRNILVDDHIYEEC